jgi:hypothetical protein
LLSSIQNNGWKQLTLNSGLALNSLATSRGSHKMKPRFHVWTA